MEQRILTDNEITALADRVKPYLTGKRYEHTLAVAEEAARLGEIYLPEKINNLRASALLHDITKRADFEKQLQYCEEFGIIIGSDDMLSPKVFHAVTGAAVAERDFADIADEEILSGIRWHTTGRAGMTVFEAIIYLADYIEPTRTFDDCIRVRRCFWDGIREGRDKTEVLRDTMILSFDLTIENLLREGALIDKDTIAARNACLAERMRNGNH
ncbi:MAG: bis(5'-nucleosyl)-tetraphosphatase (symmetrical) YqeK [Clostridia bacterium]|nr:bis(5'-nucleosyl)-tetraphosphatase (symmetrical) YqeK [Clostridia bacterium]